MVDGARFAGRSRHEALGEWTDLGVVEFEPERVFGWAVGTPPTRPRLGVSGWSRRTRDGSCPNGCRWGPGRSGLSLAIDGMPDKEQKIGVVMREFERNMTGTLERFKALAEA